MEGCDQVDTRYQKTYPGLALQTRNGASCKGKELFFFMMDDAVSSAAGAERPDVFSDMTAFAAPRLRRGRRLGEQLSSLAQRC